MGPDVDKDNEMKLQSVLAIGLISTVVQLIPADTAYAAASKAEVDLLSDIAKDGMLEVKLGEMAEAKATAANVQGFAKHMVADHSKANTKLKAAADKDHVTIPAAVSADQQSKADALSKLSGAAFDKKYMAEMVAGHEKACQAVKKESETGTGNSKVWAAETLPTIEEHKKEALSIDAKLAK
jgi:putative membrane protein